MGPQGFPAADGPPTFFDFHSYRGVREGTRSSALTLEFPGILPYHSEKETSLTAVRFQWGATDSPPVNDHLVPLPSQKAPGWPRPIPARAVSLFLENGGHTPDLCHPCCSLSLEPSFLLCHKLSTLRVSARVPPCQSCFLQTVPRAQGALSLLFRHLCSHHGARERGLSALKATHSSWELGQAVSLPCASALSRL